MVPTQVQTKATRKARAVHLGRRRGRRGGGGERVQGASPPTFRAPAEDRGRPSRGARKRWCRNSVIPWTAGGWDGGPRQPETLRVKRCPVLCLLWGKWQGERRAPATTSLRRPRGHVAPAGLAACAEKPAPAAGGEKAPPALCGSPAALPCFKSLRSSERKVRSLSEGVRPLGFSSWEAKSRPWKRKNCLERLQVERDALILMEGAGDFENWEDNEF